MADKPQDASLTPAHGGQAFLNISTTIKILVCLGVTIASYLVERQTNEELKKKIIKLEETVSNIRTQVGR